MPRLRQASPPTSGPGCLASLGVLVFATACGGPSQSPDLLLVSFDTTRADALGCYGQQPSPSPTLDRLAEQGVRVDEALATVPLTLPAHSSILTGLYPDRHAVRANDGFFVGPGLTTISEHLTEQGYLTGAFVSAMVLDSVFGLDQGFSEYSDGFDLSAQQPEQRGQVPEWPASSVTDRANAWFASELPREPDRPFFAWLHYYDPHQPLQPPAELLEQHGDPYLAEVAFADQQLGLVLDNLRILGRDDNLLVVVVGDHGEGRGDHGELGHGYFVYRSTMRVPLIFQGLGLPAGGVLPGPVSQVDLVPTVLELLGQPPLPDLDGRSVAAAMKGDTLDPVPVFGESFYPRYGFGFSELRFVQDDRHRLVLAPTPELFAWREDPSELRDLAAEAPALEQLRARIEARLEQAPGPEAAAGMDPRVTAQLEALGYVGGLSLVDPGARWQDLPDPKEQPELPTQLELLIVAARTRTPEQAVPLLEAFTAEYPAVSAARSLLVRALFLAGRPAEAGAALEPLLQARPDDPTLLTRLAELHMSQGQHERAAAALEQVVARHPSFPAPHAHLAEIARQQGRRAEAMEHIGRGLEHAPGSSQLLLVRGACLLELGEHAQAAADLRRVLEAWPDNPDVRHLLAVALARSGSPEQAVPLLREQLDRNPESVELRSLLGLALYEFGRPDEARPHLEAAAAAGLGHEPVLALADLLIQLDGDLEQAAGLLDHAEALAPGEPQIIELRAALLMKQGAVGEAERLLEEARRAREHQDAPRVWLE